MSVYQSCCRFNKKLIRTSTLLTPPRKRLAKSHTSQTFNSQPGGKYNTGISDVTNINRQNIDSIYIYYLLKKTTKLFTARAATHSYSRIKV